jgi:hypothetical protein
MHEGAALEFIYGTKESGPVFFSDKASCEHFAITDPPFIANMLKVSELTAELHDELKSIECVARATEVEPSR